MAIGQLKSTGSLFGSKNSDPFSRMQSYVQSYNDPNKLVTNVAETAEAGLKRLYDSVTQFGDPTPDQVNQLKDYIQRNTASGAFGANFNPGGGIRALINRTSKSNSFQPPSAGNAVFGGVSIPGNFATGVGRGDMLPQKPRMNDEYGMGFSRAALNREAVKQRRLRQKEDLSGIFGSM